MTRVLVRTTTTEDIEKNAELSDTPQNIMDSLGLKPGNAQIYLDGKVIYDGKNIFLLSNTFSELGVKDNDMCVLNLTVKSNGN